MLNTKDKPSNKLSLAATATLAGAVLAAGVMTTTAHAATTPTPNANATQQQTQSVSSLKSAQDQSRANYASASANNTQAQAGLSDATETNNQAQANLSQATNLDSQASSALTSATAKASAAQSAYNNAVSSAASGTTNQDIQSASNALSSATAANSAAQNQVKTDSTAVSNATSQDNQAANQLSAAQSAVNTATNQNNTAQSAYNAASDAVKNAGNPTKAVSDAQAKVNQASAAKFSADAAVNSAQTDLANKQAAQSSAQTTLDNAQQALKNAQSGQTQGPVKETITVNSAWNQFVQQIANEHKNATASYNLTDAEGQEYLNIATPIYHNTANKYISDPTQAAIPVHYENGKLSQTDQLDATRFALSLINQIRKASGMPLLYLTQQSLQTANTFVNTINTDNWNQYDDTHNGIHDSHAMETANALEASDATDAWGNPSLPHLQNRDQFHKSIYNEVLGFIFDDSTDPGHMQLLMSLNTNYLANTLGYQLDKYNISHYVMNVNSYTKNYTNNSPFIALRNSDQPAVTTLSNQIINAQHTIDNMKATNPDFTGNYGIVSEQSYQKAQQELAENPNSIFANNDRAEIAAYNKQQDDLRPYQTTINNAYAQMEQYFLPSTSSNTGSGVDLTALQQAVTNAQNALNSAKSAVSAAQTTLNNAKTAQTIAANNLKAAQNALANAQSGSGSLSDAQAKLTAATNHLNQTQETLRKAQANLTQAQTLKSQADTNLNNAKAHLQASQSNANQAATALKTAQQRFDALTATNQNVQKAKAALDAANEKLQVAQSNKDTADSALARAKTQAQQAAANLAQAQAKAQNTAKALAQAKAQLISDAKVYSDELNIKPLAPIYAGDNLPTLALTNSMEDDPTQNEVAGIMLMMASVPGDSIPTGTKITWANQVKAVADSQTPGVYTEEALVTFPDGSSVTKPVILTVLAKKNNQGGSTTPTKPNKPSQGNNTNLVKPSQPAKGNNPSQVTKPNQMGQIVANLPVGTKIAGNHVVDQNGNVVPGYSVVNGQVVKTLATTPENNTETSSTITPTATSAIANNNTTPTRASLKNGQLPQTGNNNATGLITLGIMTAVTMFGLAPRRKEN